MPEPLWAYPGVREGRIAPSFSLGASGYGYDYSYYPSYYYGAAEHVFCLGRDLVPFSSRRLEVGAVARVEQSVVVTTLHKFLLFMWHMRVPTDLPRARTVLTGGTASFVVGAGSVTPTGDGSTPRGLVHVSDGSSGLILGAPGSNAQFLLTDREQWCTVSGATDVVNNGLHRITTAALNETNGLYDRVILENSARAAMPAPDEYTMLQRLNDSGVSIRVHGLYWTSRAYCDWGTGWQERVVLQETAGRNYIRTSLALHVSKFVGPLAIRFEMELEREV